MNRNLLTLLGLKWNPFSLEVPVQALHRTPSVDRFCWRIKQVLVREGGFALVSGEPGTGKSVCLRILADHLSELPELSVAVLTHPTSTLGDFYREMGEAFGVDLRPSNRWAGFKNLRERWLSHQESTRLRPVLLVDEAQEMLPSVMNELRLLSSTALDAKLILTTVLAGDNRLLHKLQQPDLLPLFSRLRVRLKQTLATPNDLQQALSHAMEQAGNKHLMTPPLMEAVVEQAMGNYRTLMILANELLMEGAKQECHQLDEKLFLELFGSPCQKVI